MKKLLYTLGIAAAFAVIPFSVASAQGYGQHGGNSGNGDQVQAHIHDPGENLEQEQEREQLRKRLHDGTGEHHEEREHNENCDGSGEMHRYGTEEQ